MSDEDCFDWDDLLNDSWNNFWNDFETMSDFFWQKTDDSDIENDETK